MPHTTHMKYKIILLISIAQILSCFGQNKLELKKYTYGSQSYEEITIIKDSFNYIYSVGLSRAEVKGTIKYKNDTLILNSEYQADNYKIKESFNPNLKDKEFEFIITDKNNWNQTDLFAHSKTISTKKTTLKVSDIKYDSNGMSVQKKYILNEDMYFKTKGTILNIWRKNHFIELLFESKRNNSFEITFIDYPHNIDYVFFKNVKAIQKNKKLIFLGENNDILKPKFSVDNNSETTKKKKKRKVYKIKNEA